MAKERGVLPDGARCARCATPRDHPPLQSGPWAGEDIMIVCYSI